MVELFRMVREQAFDFSDGVHVTTEAGKASIEEELVSVKQTRTNCKNGRGGLVKMVIWSDV